MIYVILEKSINYQNANLVKILLLSTERLEHKALVELMGNFKILKWIVFWEIYVTQKERK
jgi:uncharacterized membrane protein